MHFYISCILNIFAVMIADQQHGLYIPVLGKHINSLLTCLQLACKARLAFVDLDCHHDCCLVFLTGIGKRAETNGVRKAPWLIVQLSSGAGCHCGCDCCPEPLLMFWAFPVAVAAGEVFEKRTLLVSRSIGRIGKMSTLASFYNSTSLGAVTCPSHRHVR